MLAGFDSEDKSLLVPRGMVLEGRIGSCERLIAEGFVSTELTGVRELEVARTGRFKGTVEADTVDIAGTLEGSLTVRELLIVRATARVTGDIAYGTLTVERGATIVGNMRPLSPEG